MTTVGLAGLDARFVAQRSFATARDPEQFLEDLAEASRDLRRAHPSIECEGMGVSLPGRVDTSGTLIFAPNLGWPRVPIGPMIAKAVGLPATVENAANACALAELWFGQHPEHVRHIVAVTVSEGIGVGLLLNGQLVHGADAMAGEFGHRVVDPSGPPCRCGRRGCWERYASNSAAVVMYLEAIHGGSGRVKPSRPLRFDDLSRLAAAGDRHAIAALHRMARALGEGLGDLMTGLAPEVIVLVGEVTALWESLGPIVSEGIAARALPDATTRIVPTDPTTRPRLRGAIALVVQQHFGTPVVA